MVSGFLVEAQKLVMQQALEATVQQTYQTIFSQTIAPFMAMTAAVQLGANLYEVLQKAKAEAQIFGTAPKSESVATKEIDTEISRGFCLSIPELGDLLISHDGDVVFDAQKSIEKSLKISAPAQVVLNNTTAKDIDLEATAAILTGKTKSEINSLRFRGIGEAGNLTNGLFIDTESELSVGSLSLEEALLLNTGKLTIQQQMDLNGGYFFNTGSVATTADPSVFNNMAYLFNGSTGTIDAIGRLLMSAANFSNLGNVKAKSMSVVSSGLLDNAGSIETTNGFEAEGLGTIVNNGLIDGKSGDISISGEKFEHRRGEIRAAKVEFGSNETVLAGSVVGQEGYFHGNVANSGSLNFQRGVIDGLFGNSSKTVNFEQKLELVGRRAEIRNDGKITTAEIVSDAATGILDGGEFSATSILTKKHLQLGTNLPLLTSMQIDADAKLLVEAKSFAPQLKKIINAGDARILAVTPELTDLQDTSAAHTQIENSTPITGITNLDHLLGKLDIKASLPGLIKLNLQSGASLTALGGADFSALKDLRVQSDATLLAEASSKFDNLKDIANFGMITSKVRLDKLDSIYNSPTATLQFLERAKVRGRIVTKNDKAAIPAMASLPEGKIGIFNEGKILTKIKLKPGEIFDPKAVDFFGVDVKSGNYAASKDAIFRMESGGIRANDFINDGLLYSPTRLKFWQYGHVTKWGRGAAEDGIEYEIDTSSPFKLDDTFKPIINGPKKELKIISKGGLEISKPLNMDVDLNIETPVFNGNENLTVRSFKAKTTTFNNTKILSAKDFIDIETTNFTNTSGKLQTHGDGRIKVNGLFRNTGGGTLEKNVPETITNYIWNGSGAVPEEMVFLRDIYKPELDKAGVITCGGLLDIFAGKFDNSFGILNAARKIEIKSLKEICNECGLICSGGPAILNGTLLKNGYMKGSESVAGVDPNVPIKTPQSVPYQIWVSSGYERHNGMWPFGSDEWIDTSHAETRWRHDLVITNYQAKTQHTSIAQYPGYIFSNGDLELQMDSDAYLGTIVSGGDIYIKGTKQENINFADRGLLIARGNVTAELEKAALAQLAIQAQNIFINLTQELLIRDIVQPLLMPDGSVSQLINLQKLGRQFGMLTDGSTFAEQGFSFPSPTGLVPTNISSFGGFSVHQTAEAGFLGPKPSTKFFMSELQDSILNQLITLTLTPIYGRDILLKIDLAGQLRKTGAVLGEAFRGSQEIVLRGGDPAILFDKSTNLDVEVEVEGEKALIPLYNPYLLTDAVSRFLNKIQAEKLLHVQSLENIHLEPGQINLESEHLTLESKKQIQIAAEFVYNETGNRIGVNPVSLTRPGTITLSGDKGVETKGAQLSAKKLQVRSSEGNVVDMNMPLDPVYTFLAPRTGLFFKTPKTVLMRQEAVTSSFHGEDGITFSAPKGTIWQSGTELAAGEDGIVFDSKSYLWQPAFQRSGVYCSDSRGFSSNEIKFPKASLTYTPGAIVYKTKDATLMGARIVAGTISNPVDGTFRAAPAYATQESHSYTSKSGFMGLGRSSLEIRETRKTPEPTQIITDHFASLGVGTCEFEGAVVKALDVAITKNLSEKAAYERVHTVVTQKSSGFFAPKIKGDPFVDALRGVRGVVTFGDVAPAAFNLIGATAQTLNHAQMLANLSTIGNPFSTVAQILTNRFMTGPVYSNIKTVTEVKESKPLQSRIETGILRVVNDRTHLEGIWNVTGRAAIETKTLTTAAPKHEISQKTETSGWSISLSPAALLTAGLAFVTPVGIGLTETLGCLPNVAVHDSDGNASSTTYAQQVLTAGDLFVRCDNAVFSGSTIHAKTLEMIVSGDLTVETLANTFHSESSSRDFGLCLGAIASLTQDVKVDNRFVDPRLGAVPTIRIADEEALSVKVQQLAKIVGTERFYLTVGGLLHKKSAEVGLKPDGVVVRNDAERIQAGRVLEEKVREVESHSRRVINPAVGEFVAMMSQVDEFKQLRAQIAAQQMINGVPREERKRTDEAIMRTAQREEANVSRVAEETIAVNDQLNQKLKSTIGEGEITKLTSGKPVSAKTRASIAKEVSGAIDDIQAKKEEIAGNSSTGSNEFEQSIIAASKETQLGILNDRIGIYQQLLFALSRSPEPPTITRLKEGLGAVTGIVVDNCRAAESMTYEQYKTYQMQKMPEGARSDPEVIDIVGTSYFVNKGLAKIGQGIGKVFGAIDDATGNVFSDWMRKLSDGIDSTFEKVEREMISGGTPEVIAQNLADIGNISTQIFAPGAIGKAGVAIAGVTKLRGAMLGAVTKSTATVIDGSKIGMSWFGNWFDRGYAFEKFLETLFPGAKLPDRFKTFDFFRIENQVARTGTAISAKTLDTNTLSRIANPNLVRYKINGYINEMLNFTEHRLEGLKLTSPQITARELHLAIPANTSPIHMQQIENCIQYGIDNKVKVVITKVK